MEIRIREVTKEDIENLAQLVLNFRNEHSRMIGGEGTFVLDDAMEEVRRYLARDDTGYFENFILFQMHVVEELQRYLFAILKNG